MNHKTLKTEDINDLIASLDAFLDVMDAMLADGIELSDNEAAARAQGLAVIARLRGKP
jgi:hypothetical protein